MLLDTPGNTVGACFTTDGLFKRYDPLATFPRATTLLLDLVSLLSTLLYRRLGPVIAVPFTIIVDR